VPELSFNGRSAVKWGATNIDRVYCGPTLVWSLATGLPYSTAFTPGSGVPPQAGWTTAQLWRSTAIGGSDFATAVGGSPATAVQQSINAYNVTLTAKVHSAGNTEYVGLMARVNGTTYYSGEMSDKTAGPLTSSVFRIVKTVAGVRTILGSWNTGHQQTATITFSVVGDILTISRGAWSQTVTDASIVAPGAIGIMATTGQGFSTLNATAV